MFRQLEWKSSIYISGTGKNLNVRLAEHKRAITNNFFDGCMPTITQLNSQTSELTGLCSMLSPQYKQLFFTLESWDTSSFNGLDLKHQLRNTIHLKSSEDDFHALSLLKHHAVTKNIFQNILHHHKPVQVKATVKVLRIWCSMSKNSCSESLRCKYSNCWQL